MLPNKSVFYCILEGNFKIKYTQLNKLGQWLNFPKLQADFFETYLNNDKDGKAAFYLFAANNF